MPDLLKIADSLYRLRIPGDRAHLLNCYLWQEPDGVTLIDTGWPGEAGLIAEALAMLGLRRLHVKRVVLTHFHEDHTGAAAEIADWADVEVIAGAADAPFIRGDEPGPLPVLTDAERTLRSDLTEPP
ncbi:MBL fold metallo-hydrolase, partial [Mycobacterium tuberculosis]